MRFSHHLFSLAVVLACATVVSADASHAVLHPNGFGMQSYCAWKAQQGLSDSSGQKDQALYFAKDTSTATFAAAVAVIDGFEGESTAAIANLGFEWRLDGHCGAGAPRFNIRYQPLGMPDPAARQTMFVGCAAMASGVTHIDPNGRLWQQKSFAGIIPQGTITSLSIVFDEGNDVGNGFVYLDNIQVGAKTWTSAADNANE